MQSEQFFSRRVVLGKVNADKEVQGLQRNLYTSEAKLQTLTEEMFNV